MNFYYEWEKSLSNIEENKKYTKRFLNKDPESLEVFNSGSTEDLIFVCKMLLQIPMGNFIYCVDKNVSCTTDMIVQYSNLKNAIIDVPRVLKFSESPMTFTELGKAIIKAKSEGACKKYGENHAKLANELSMVSLEKRSATYVCNTSFGNFSVGLSEEDRIELVKRLIIRNEFIQKIIYLSKKGFVNYNEIACETLSESTATRRKSNVKQLVNLILLDNELSNNIVW